MDNWIIFVLALSQIVVLYGISARTCLHAINKIFLDKNPVWVHENPDFYARFSKPKFAVFFLYFVGAAWLLGLSTIMSELDTISLFTYTVMPNFVWQLVLMVYLGVAYFRIAKKIPLAAKRSANLARRNLRDYVHPIWTILCAACYLIVFVAYATALSLKQIQLDVFFYRVAYVILVLLLTVGFLRYSLRRKKNFLDDAFGPTYRRWEVIANFIFSLSTGALVVLWVMANDLTDTLWLSPLNMALTLSISVQALLIYFTFNFRIKRALGDKVPAEMSFNRS